MKCDKLKAFDITVAEEGYCEGIVKYRRAVYDKFEADKVIAHNKYKRCLAMADYAMYHHYRMLEIYGRSLDNDRAVFKINYGLRWHRRWLELAEKLKEAK